MTPATVFRGRRVAVFGLGGSGISTARALLAGGAEVAAFDDSPSRIEVARAAGIPVVDLRAADWSAFDALVLAPGVPLTHPAPHWTVGKAQAAGIEIIGDVELFVRERRAHAPAAPFVAITGTNGKSTTTALIGHLLAKAGREVAIGGNIGTPVLDLPPPSPARVHVIEVSSFQIDLAPSLDPSVAVMLNLSEDHLDRHGTMERYAGLKERMAAGAGRTGAAVIGVDDGLSQAMADRLSRDGIRVVRISARRLLAEGVYADGTRLIRARDGASETIARLSGIGSLRGAHNAQNAAAAAAVALELGVPAAGIARHLATFPGLPHRMEEAGRAGRVLFINDSKATNADAAARALASFEDIFWIAGGKPKTGGIVPLAPYFPRLRMVYLIGDAAQEFAATLAEAGVTHVIAETMERAVELAAADASRSEAAEPVVLLSPACASFDQFPNFEVRGDRFRTLVHERIAEPQGITP